MQKSFGFTLIELLVVVLIIGILAAVAVPQYQKAVEKSKMAELNLLMSNLEKATDLWLLENGGIPANDTVLWGPDENLLSIDLSNSWTSDGSARMVSKNNHLRCDGNFMTCGLGSCYSGLCYLNSDGGPYDASIYKEDGVWHWQCNGPEPEKAREHCRLLKSTNSKWEIQ